MSAIKFKFSIKELNIEFEGEREDLPQVRKDLGQQLGQVLPMPTAFGPVQNGAKELHMPQALPPDNEIKPKRNRSKSSSSGNKKSEVFDVVHDAEKWGVPVQGWNPTKKAIWLLRVLSNVRQVDEYTVGELAANFNKHFKQSGLVTASNISRDLGKVKGKYVTELTNQDPSKWSLMQQGVIEADRLIRVARGEETDNATS